MYTLYDNDSDQPLGQISEAQGPLGGQGAVVIHHVHRHGAGDGVDEAPEHPGGRAQLTLDAPELRLTAATLDDAQRTAPDSA